jgi:hypothetical protein
MSLSLVDEAIVMDADELWEAVGVLSRVMREAKRRNLPLDMFRDLDMARAIVLGMFSTATRYEPAS